MLARPKALWLVISLMLLSLACSLFGGKPTPEPTNTPAPVVATATSKPEAPPATSTPKPTELPTATAAKGTELQVINSSGTDIWYLFVSPSDANEWGDDQLGGDTIPAGGSYTVTDLEDGVYDVQVRDADDNAIQTIWELEIVGSVTQVIEKQALVLEIYNGSEKVITRLFVSSVESDTWGNDVLGGSTIGPDETFSLEGLEAGAYDIQAKNADDEIIETVYNVSMDGYYYWNVVGKTDLPSNAVLRFEDDFKDNRNNWGDVSSEGVVYNAPANGEYCIDIISDQLTAWEWYEPFRPDQFVAEVACNVPEDSSSSCGLGFGPDGDNLYWFEVSPSDQTFALFLLLNDEWQDRLVEWTESKNIYPKGWNYLSIERLDGIFSVFINGVLQASVDSNQFPTGRIGLGGATYDQGNVRVCLDNLRVWRLE